jgi:cytochrome c5
VVHRLAASVLWAFALTSFGVSPAAAQAPSSAATHRAVLDRYCTSCHNGRLRTANLNLDKAAVDLDRVSDHAAVLEKVLQKLETGAMPPPGVPRPAPDVYRSVAGWLGAELDRAAALSPNPGRPTAHRLNRAEYTNAIRDLLALEIDARSLLPTDDLSFGFDNNADILGLSPGLLERYMSAARKIASTAIGDPALRPADETYKLSPLLVQDDRMSEDLPFGSRGGMAFQHYFPLDAEYVIRIRLTRDNIYTIRGLSEPEQIDLRIDGATVHQFQVGGPASLKSRTDADAGLDIRLPIKAGLRRVGVTFRKRSLAVGGVAPEHLPVGNFILSGTARASGFRELMGVATVQVGGPYHGGAPADTPSRRAIFVCRPPAGAGPADEERCAKSILTGIARRAFRRPVASDDAAALMDFYREGRAQGSFETGVQHALARVLVDPEFLFRVERDPPKARAGAAYRLSDLELASRLSFFLWSSIPDDELLGAAEKGRLKNPEVLSAQVRRMLADPRSSALVGNFAAQWLLLRNMRAVAPDVNLFPEFDENLRLSMLRETELFVESQIREDRGIGELLTADYTFLNERLAGHYGVPGVYGSQFRRVKLSDSRRRGLLGQGSILTVTSHATRTSPVLRGKWVLDNLLGAPPPPPPADVPALPEKGDGAEARSVRARLEQHRSNPTCASCHSRMDPLGFALENFDGIGKWRASGDDGAPIDAAAALPDGTKFDGPSELRGLLESREKEFVATVTTKLLTYALGRGMEYYDQPAVRAIVRRAEASDYRWSSVVLGIVESVPFQMRRVEP